MDEVSRVENKTILYVSHNMNTIRELCDRCIVLDHGKLIFDGETEEAITLYLGSRANTDSYVDLRSMERRSGSIAPSSFVRMTAMWCDGAESNLFEPGAFLNLTMSFESPKDVDNLQLRIIIKDMESRPVSMVTTNESFSLNALEETDYSFALDLSRLAPGSYTVNPVVYEVDSMGNDVKQDVLDDIYCFEIIQPPGFYNNLPWRRRSWGYLYGNPLVLARKDAGKRE